MGHLHLSLTWKETILDAIRSRRWTDQWSTGTGSEMQEPEQIPYSDTCGRKGLIHTAEVGEYSTYFVQNVCRRGFIVGDCVSWPEHAYVVFHPCLNWTADCPSCRTKNVWEWAIASELSGHIAPLHIQGYRLSKRKGEEKPSYEGR